MKFDHSGSLVVVSCDEILETALVETNARIVDVAGLLFCVVAMLSVTCCLVVKAVESVALFAVVRLDSCKLSVKFAFW